MIEIDYGTVSETKIVWREDELVGPSIESLHHAIGAYSRFCCLHHTGTDSADAMAGKFGLVNQITCLLADHHLL